MLAQSFVGGCRTIRSALDRTLAVPSVADDSPSRRRVCRIRAALLDVAEQLRASYPYAAIERSPSLTSADDDPVLTVLRRRYADDDPPSIDAVRASLATDGHDLEALLNGHRLRVVDGSVVVPLGVDPDYRNWQVLVRFVAARVDEMTARVERVVARLRADGVDDDAAVVRRWQSVSQWLTALEDVLTRAIGRSRRFDHYTTPTDEGLSPLVGWSTDQLRQS